MSTRVLFAVVLLASCGDPVHDAELAALPGENPNVPVGEYHRAGQPCVLCHGPGGPASDAAFSLAGTIFAQPSSAVGVDNATVAFTDTTGSTFEVQTDCVGNFFVKKTDWDPSFPIFVRVFKNGASKTMQGQIGRERSCANCHADPPPGSPLDFSQVGHVSLYDDGTTPPPASSNCPVSPVVAP